MTRNEVRCAIEFFHKLAHEQENAYYIQRAMEIATYYSSKELA